MCHNNNIFNTSLRIGFEIQLAGHTGHEGINHSCIREVVSAYDGGVYEFTHTYPYVCTCVFIYMIYIHIYTYIYARIYIYKYINSYVQRAIARLKELQDPVEDIFRLGDVAMCLCAPNNSQTTCFLSVNGKRRWLGCTERAVGAQNPVSS